MDIKVKQRLVGAVVLVGFAVILLPIVFHGSNVKTEHLSMQKTIPAPPIQSSLSSSVLAQTQKVKTEKKAIPALIKANQIVIVNTPAAAPVVNLDTKLKGKK